MQITPFTTNVWQTLHIISASARRYQNLQKSQIHIGKGVRFGKRLRRSVPKSICTQYKKQIVIHTTNTNHEM